jgi:hypothetical protein
MHETLTHSPVPSEAPSGIAAEALRAEAWAGEPFVRADEDPGVALAPGTAFRDALDAAVAEIEAGYRMDAEAGYRADIEAGYRMEIVGG